MKYHIAISGGGTGGHVMPALALAEELTRRDATVTLFGTHRGIEAKVVPKAGLELVTFNAKPLIGGSLLNRIGALGALAVAVVKARRELTSRGIALVISVGGYASMPASLAALTLRIPLVLVEPNALPGIASRVTARFSQKIFTAFHASGSRLAKNSLDSRIHRTGVPLRKSLIKTLSKAPSARRPESPYRFFVFGGSQGAKQLNDHIPDAIALLNDYLKPERIEVVHQTGDLQLDEVDRRYMAHGIKATVIAFEHSMETRYNWSDVVVCRAGATTIAELALAKRPAVLIPLTHIGGGEQVENARAYALSGGGLVLDGSKCSTKACHEILASIMSVKEKWLEMGKLASEFINPRSTEDIIDKCEHLLISRTTRN